MPRQRPKLTFRIIRVPRADAEQCLSRAIDLIAEALAELVIADAREEVAGSLGVDPESMAHERAGLDRELGAAADPMLRGVR